MHIVKVPGINGLGKTKGCENAPNSILDFLKDIYSNEQGKSIDVKSLDLEEIHLDNGNIEECNKLIYKNSFETFEEKSRVVFLGGDHSISYSLTRAFLDYCQNSGKEPCLIVFDAHADCMVPMKEPTHEEWLRKLIEDGFPTKNILLVGVRNYWKDEIKFLKERKIQQISVNLIEEDIDNIADTIMEFCNGKEVYVSVDVDVLDAEFVKATGYPEVGGLTPRQLIYILQRLKKVKTLKAFDIVEINPERDSRGETVRVGAKLLSEMM